VQLQLGNIAEKMDDNAKVARSRVENIFKYFKGVHLQLMCLEDLLLTVSSPADQEDFRRAEENRKITDWLSSLNFYIVQENNYSQHAAGTGGWLLNDPKFQHWISTSGENLWCHRMCMYHCLYQGFIAKVLKQDLENLF
jgi:hypothetical protein